MFLRLQSYSGAYHILLWIQFVQAFSYMRKAAHTVCMSDPESYLKVGSFLLVFFSQLLFDKSSVKAGFVRLILPAVLQYPGTDPEVQKYLLSRINARL